MMDIIKGIPLDTNLSMRLAKKVHKIYDFDNIKSEGILVAGSHARGTSNQLSDYDITFYYTYYLDNILSAKSPELYLTDYGKVSQTEHGIFNINHKEYDIKAIPIISRDQSKDELMKRLLGNSMHTLWHLVLDEEAICNTNFTRFVKSIQNDFAWDRSSAFKYASGHSAFLFREALNISEAVTSPILHISKNLLRAIDISLNGMSLLSDATLFGNITLLMENYPNFFSDKEQSLISTCLKRKRDGKKVTSGVKEWISDSQKLIVSIQEHIDEELMSAFKKSSLHDISDEEKESNVKILDDYIFSLYEHKCYIEE